MGRVPRRHRKYLHSVCTTLADEKQIIDEMARCGCLGTVWGINGGASVGGPPIDRYGTPEQKRKYLAPLLRGEQRHCLCVTEPASAFPQPT